MCRVGEILSGGFLFLTLILLKFRFSNETQIDSKVILVSELRCAATTVPYKVFGTRSLAIICHPENDHNVILWTPGLHAQAQANAVRCLWGTHLIYSHTLPDIDTPKSLLRHTCSFALPHKSMHNAPTLLNTSETECRHS